MADTNFASKSIIQRTRCFALPAVVLFTLAGAILLRHRGRNNALISPIPLVPNPTLTTFAPTSDLQPKPSPKRSTSPWLILLGISLFCAVLLVVIQIAAPELSSIIFIGILTLALLYGLFRSISYVARHFNVVLAPLTYCWRLLNRNADIGVFIGGSIAIGCAIWSAFLFRDAASNLSLVGQALRVFIICCGAGRFVIALKPDTVISERWLEKTVRPINQTQPFHLRRAFWGLVSTMSGIFLLFILAETNGGLLDSSVLKHVDSVLQFALLVFGMLLLIAGMGGRMRLPVMTRREIVVLSSLILFSLALRSVALDTNVHRLIDEVNFMGAIPRLWAKPDTLILSPFGDTTAFTWLYTLFQSGISNILGSGLIGLRLISSIFGTLGVVALYFLVRTLFHNKSLALVAAILLATFPAHLHFSRLGLNNIADPFFGTLALAFLMRGLQSHDRSDYVIAGAALGLAQYFYEGGRLLYPPLLVAAFIVAWLLMGHRKIDFIHACYALFAALLVAAPVYYTLIGGSHFLTPRLDSQLGDNAFLTSMFENSISISDWLGNHLLYPFLLYISMPDQGWFYGGQQALIILPLIPFFLLGMVYAFWKSRSPAVIVLFLWTMMTAFGNSILRDKLWVPRYVVVFPALVVFVALGLYATLLLAWPRSKPKQWFYVALAGMGIVLGTIQTVFYFRDQVPYFLQQFQGQNAGQEDWNDAFFRMVDLPSGTEVHIIMDKPMWDVNTDAFLSYYRLNLKVDTLRPIQVTTAYLTKIAASSASQQVFFINPSQKEVLAQLRQYFSLDDPQFGYENVPMQYQLGLYKAHVLTK